MKSSRRFIRDASKVTRVRVFGIGVTAGLVVSLCTRLFRELGMSQLSIELTLGNLFTGGVDASARLSGLIIHLLISGLCAFGYALIFKSAHRSGVVVGVTLALFHWFAVGWIVGFVPIDSFVPVVGFFFAGEGLRTAILFFLTHLLYGATIGELFDQAALRSEYPRPITA